MKKVSVIMPVYNAAAFLQGSVESILKQTYNNIELIIVDDSSTDNSLLLARAFESNTVKVINQPNGGAAVARNTGLANARGDYIQFMDADDYLSPDKIEKQVEALESNHGKVAVCNYVQFANEEDLKNSKNVASQQKFIFSSDDPAEFLINLYGGYGEPNFIQTNSWLVPKSIIDKSGGWRNYRCPDDDGEFFARVILASEGIVYVPGIINYYRKPAGGSTLSGSRKQKLLKNTLLTIDLKCDYLQKFKSSQGFRRAFATQYYEFAVYNYPRNKILSKIAEKRFRQFDYKVRTPMLGGKIFMLLDKMFGWKIVRLLRYFLKEKQRRRK